jgi:predicted O-linked N-acetylglucosamine transferase (SPINDLY family)
MSDQAAAEVIRNDRIDILVDLTVHTSNNRLPLFTWKPAPIQVTYLGSPMSTGLRAMDYRISDPYLDPPDVASIWPERIVRLPETFWCYDPLTDQPPVNPLPALAGKPLTFGCLNKFAKVNRHVLELWARVLLAAPNSRLILLADPGSHRDRTISVFAEAGVEPDRIQFESRRSRADYMRLYHNLDIALDTFPYNGHTTSLDALWMGVPVVSLVGSLPVSRAGLSLATNIGLPEFAVDSSEAFVARALDLANDLPKLAELRSTLRARMQASPLMDSRRFVRSMEAIFREIWRQWCCGDAGNPPR